MKRFSVEEYHRLIEAGILSEDDKVELLEGFLVPKKAKTPKVCFVRVLSSDAIRSMARLDCFCAGQGVVTTDDSEPEPDVTLVRGNPRAYARRHPSAEDTKLLLEVSDASLAQDRGTKKRIYARAGFPIYWFVNIPDRQIEVYTQPSGPCEQPDYAMVVIFKEGKTCQS